MVIEARERLGGVEGGVEPNLTVSVSSHLRGVSFAPFGACNPKTRAFLSKGASWPFVREADFSKYIVGGSVLRINDRNYFPQLRLFKCEPQEPSGRFRRESFLPGA